MTANLKTLPTPSSLDRINEYASGILSGEIVAGPHVRNACRRHFDDLEKGPDRGLYFDIDAADRVFGFFESVLKLSEGQFEGLPFHLQPSQAFIVGSLFGWKRADGTRRFRRAYIEQGKGNGKSPVAGGIGLYGMLGDGEAGSQVYAAAAKREQAGILFADAVKMVKASPALAKRIDFSGGPGREYNMAHHASGSFFRPVSRDTGKSGSGPRPFFVLADEVHELPDGKILEMLERGFKFRREPLLFMITNSGSDRNSICWAEHEWAVKVAAGNIDAVTDPTYVGDVLDDSTFAYVCALDQARTVTYDFDIALRHAVESCTCNAKITLTDLPSPQDFAALVTHGKGGRITSPRGWVAPITPTVQLLLDAFAIPAISEVERNEALRQSKGERPFKGHGQNLRKDGKSPESGTGSTGSARSSLTQIGRLSEPERQSTGSLPSRLSKSSRCRAGDAESAEAKLSVSGWITATLQEMYEDCSAIPAMRALVCSEIISKLYNGHSNTCETRQRFRLQSGCLTEELPADDALNDPSCWPKANPLLGTTITEEYLAGVVAQAKNIPAKQNGILRLHFCVWTDADSAWMSREALEPRLADFDIAEHKGKDIFAGLDLSQSRDITAAGFVVKTGQTPEGKPTFDAWVEAWTPGDTMHARADRDKIPYPIWHQQGHIHAPPGENISYRHVAQTLVEYSQEYKVRMCAYDRYAYRRFEEDAEEVGLDIPFVEHPQGGTKKAKPTEEMKKAAEQQGREPEGLWFPGSLKMFEDAIYEGRIRFKRNPVLISAMMSAVTESDKWDNRWLAKQKSINKIDAAVALVMAFGAANALAVEKKPMVMMMLG